MTLDEAFSETDRLRQECGDPTRGYTIYNYKEDYALSIDELETDPRQGLEE